MAEPLILRIDVDDKGVPKVKALRGELGKLSEGVKDSERHMGKWEKSLAKVRDTLFSMKTILAAVGGAYAALRLARVAKGWMDLAGAQEAAESSLKQVMVSMGRYSDEFFAATKRQASALQEFTGVGDETILQGQKFLFTFKQISDEAMPRTTKAMMDLAALMGGDVQRAALTLGKAAMGLTGELRRVGITVDETTFKQKGFLGILQEIETQVKGQAVTFRQTWLGALMALRSEWGDLREVVGGWLRDIARPWVEKLVTGLRTATDWLKRMKDEGRLDEWSSRIEAGISKAFGTMKSVFMGVKNSIDELSFAFGILLKVMKAIVAYKMASFLFSIGDAAISAAANIDTLSAALVALKVKIAGLGIATKGGLIGLALYGGWELGKFLECFTAIQDAATWMAMQLEYAFKYVKKEILVSWNIIERDINKITVNIIKGVNFMLSNLTSWINDLIESANKLSMIDIKARMPELKIDYSSALARQERAMLRISEINTEFNKDIANMEEAYLSMFSTAYAGFNAHIIKGTAEAFERTKDLTKSVDDMGNAFANAGMKTEAWRDEISRSAIEMSDLIEDELEPDIMSAADAFREIDEAIRPISDSIKEMSDMVENEFEPDIISVEEHLRGLAEAMDPSMKEMRRLWEEGWENMEDHFVYSWAAMMKGGVDDFKDAMRAVYDIFRNMVARIVAEKMFRPLAESLVGSLSGAMGSLFGALGLQGLLPQGAATAGGTAAAGTSAPTAATAGLSGFFQRTLPGFGAGGPTWGGALGAAGLGSIGYSTIGAMIGMPQGQYSGLTAGLGAGVGFAFGGPIGAVIGSIVGGLGGALFGKKPPVPEVRVEWTIDQEGFRQSLDYWGGGLERSQELVDEIEQVIGQQYSNYSKMAAMTESNIAQMKVNIDALGRTEIRDIGEMIARIPTQFAISNLPLYEELFPGRMETAEMRELADAIRAQEEAIREYERMSGARIATTMLMGGDTFLIISRQERTLSEMREELDDIMGQMSEVADTLMQEFLSFEKQMAEMLGGAFSAALQTREFADFKRGLKASLAESVKTSLAQRVFDEIGMQIMRRMWDIWQTSLGVTGQGFGGLVEYMAGMIIQGTWLSPAGDQAVFKIGQLTDVLDDYRPVFDNLVSAMEFLEMALGLNAETTDDNTAAVSENNDLLERQRQIEEFIMSLTTGPQAPVQSLEAIENVYQQLLRTDENLTQLFGYITGTYLPFMQAYGGDYANVFQGIISDLRALAGDNIMQAIQATGAQAGMQAAGEAAAQAKTTITIEGYDPGELSARLDSLTGKLDEGIQSIISSLKTIDDAIRHYGEQRREMFNYGIAEIRSVGFQVIDAISRTDGMIPYNDYGTVQAANVQAEMQAMRKKAAGQMAMPAAADSYGTGGFTAGLDDLIGGLDSGLENIVAFLDSIDNTIRQCREQGHEIFGDMMAEVRDAGRLIADKTGSLRLSLGMIKDNMESHGDQERDLLGHQISEIKDAGDKITERIGQSQSYNLDLDELMSVLQKISVSIDGLSSAAVRSFASVNNIFQYYGDCNQKQFDHQTSKMENIGNRIIDAINSISFDFSADDNNLLLQEANSLMSKYFSLLHGTMDGLDSLPMLDHSDGDASQERGVYSMSPQAAIQPVNVILDSIPTAGIETVLAESLNNMAERIEGISFGPWHTHIYLDGRQIAEVVAMELEAGNGRLTNAVRQVM